MKPYYQDDVVTIYHGDCREIVPELGSFDLLLTDPPYEKEAHTRIRRTRATIEGRVDNSSIDFDARAVGSSSFGDYVKVCG